MTGPARVALVLPSYWEGDISLMGGGDRYVSNLAAALSQHTDTTLVTFGPRTRRQVSFGLQHLVLAGGGSNRDNPLPTASLRLLMDFDLIHAFQFRSVVTSALALLCRLRRVPLVVTDLGGGGRSPMNPAHLHRLVPRFTSISEFSRSLLPAPARQRCEVVLGGISLERFALEAGPRGGGVLQVSRIMPHKGMNYLIEAAGEDLAVTIAGRVIDQPYLRFLERQAVGRKVRFVIDPTDDEVTDLYKAAFVTVAASVYRDVFGGHWPTSELLGLPLLESMAVGTPVICTDVGAMPEYVVDGETGYVVPPNDPQSLRQRIVSLLDDPSAAKRMGRSGHRHVQQFTWASVAERTLEVYRELGLGKGSSIPRSESSTLP